MERRWPAATTYTDRGGGLSGVNVSEYAVVAYSDFPTFVAVVLDVVVLMLSLL